MLPIIFDITHLSNAFLEHFLQGVAPLRDVGILLSTLTQISINYNDIYFRIRQGQLYIGSSTNK